MKWDEDCQAMFDWIKQYLQEPLVLLPPIQGRPHIIFHNIG